MKGLTGIFFLLSAGSLFAEGSGAPAQPGGLMSGMGGMVPMMIAMFAIIYFFMIRPEQKKQKEKQALMSNLKKGDKVLTLGGIYGTIAAVKDDSFMLKISDNSTVRIAKSAIGSVIKEKEESEDKSDAEKKA